MPGQCTRHLIVRHLSKETMPSPSNILREHGVFLAHCSSYPQLYASDLTAHLGPLERLTNAAQSQLGLSCSTIGPYDSFNNRNFTGKIGLILVPPSFDAITHATPKDGGTSAPAKRGDPREPLPKFPITEQLLRTAIKHRPNNEHNEVCLKAYHVVGVFMCPPVDFTPKVGDTPIRVTEPEIVDALPNQRFFLLDASKLHEVSYDCAIQKFVSTGNAYSHGDINREANV